VRRVRLILWRLQRFDARLVSVGNVLGIDLFKIGSGYRATNAVRFLRIHSLGPSLSRSSDTRNQLEIGMSRKRKPLTPRHKRLTRQGRLQAAITWLRSYPGKNIARGYRKHFGVDSLCAIRELRLLDVAIDPA
jgi:hypothetical protein